MKKGFRSAGFLLSLLKTYVSSALRFKAILLVLGVLVCLVMFGIIVWQVGAKDGLLHTGGQVRDEESSKADPALGLLPEGFDCSDIYRLGIDRQENFRAGTIMIACGLAQGGSGGLGDPDDGDAYGGADVNLVTSLETSPNVTQSETFTTVNPDNPNQIVVAYNDSRGVNQTPINISGASVSTDGGATFTRLTAASGQSPFPGTVGDPVVLYNKPTGTWLTVWLDWGCGDQGLGGFKSMTPWDPSPASWTHFCVHVNDNDDRNSGWADNNPSSPFFGRMYVSWNNFNVGDGRLEVSRTTDNGLTWSPSVAVTTDFIRNVQITGDPLSGDVYIAGMDENAGTGCDSGCGTNRNNKIYRSTDGGATWTNTYMGPAFQGPCRSSSGFFCTMYSSPEYWRHMGWGQPAAYNGVVSYVYGARDPSTAPIDPGDIYYIRSTDAGTTFSPPLKLNTDTDHTKAQWQANLSVSNAGTLLATWYDETPRVAASCQPSSPTTPCYQMYARKSYDNGLTWLPPDTLSDVASPLPLQPDPGIVDTYAGDYDYGSAVLTKHVTAWVDGRVALGGASQQNAFTDRDLVGFAVTNTTPACNSIISMQPTSFVINLSDAAIPATVQATDLTVNGIPANSFVLSNGNATMTFNYNVSPVLTQGIQTMSIPADAFMRASDNIGNFAFWCTFRYDAVNLTVSSTDPPVGGTFNPPAPSDYQYDVSFSEAVDPTSVSTADLMVSGNSGPSITAVTVINANTTVRFTLHMNFGGELNASIAAGAVTDPFGNPNADFAGSYTAAGCPPQNHYNIAQIGGSIVPGTLDTGNHLDDGMTMITLPFSYALYDQIFTSVNLSSNGNAQFTTTDATYENVCLPWATHDYTVLPYWDDLMTNQTSAGCAPYGGVGCGIFTSITGMAPNRIFNIEWRTVYFGTPTTRANFELRVYEGQDRFDVIYGEIASGNSRATAGVQKNDTDFDPYFCDGTGSPATGGQSYILVRCGTPTPTTTPTQTPSPSPSPSPSARTAFDFDGDGKADLSVFRPFGGEWYYQESSTNVTRGFQFGGPGGRITPGDFTGDGKTDIAFWRESSGFWNVLRSEDFTYFAFPFGSTGDIPTPADYDGDGRADAAVFRPSVATWFILRSSGGVSSIPFGISSDVPVPADYDGDGKADVGIYRPGPGQWWNLRSSDGSVFAATFGSSTDKPVPGDYTGDGKADVAFWRPSNGNWFILRSEDQSFYAFPFGANGDKPAPGDFDGDGIIDAGVFRPSDTNWYILKSTGGLLIQQYGAANDIPLPNAFVP